MSISKIYKKENEISSGELSLINLPKWSDNVYRSPDSKIKKVSYIIEDDNGNLSEEKSITIKFNANINDDYTINYSGGIYHKNTSIVDKFICNVDLYKVIYSGIDYIPSSDSIRNIQIMYKIIMTGFESNWNIWFSSSPEIIELLPDNGKRFIIDSKDIDIHQWLWNNNICGEAIRIKYGLRWIDINGTPSIVHDLDYEILIGNISINIIHPMNGRIYNGNIHNVSGIWVG